MTDYLTMPNAGSFTIRAPEPVFLVRFHGNDSPIATVHRDGRVEVHQDGGEAEAARVFWDNIRIHGQTLMERIAQLEADNEYLKHRLEYADFRLEGLEK